MADFKDLLVGITDEAVKTQLQEEYDKVNKERGSYGQKLIEKDKELGELRTSSVEYKKAWKILADSGTKAEDIPQLLEKMKVTKTIQDEYELTKSLLQDKAKGEEKAVKELQRLKTERAVEKIFNKAREEFKDSTGKVVKLADSFIDLDTLYSGITDLSNEAVLTEKINLALKSAHEKQSKVLDSIGFQGAKVHTTPEGDQKTNPNATVQEAARKIMKEQGAAAAIAFIAASNKKG